LESLHTGTPLQPCYATDGRVEDCVKDGFMTQPTLGSEVS